MLWLEFIVLSIGLEFSIFERLYNGLKGCIVSKVMINILLYDIVVYGRFY